MEKRKIFVYINGIRKGFAKNGNTVENPYSAACMTVIQSEERERKKLTYMCVFIAQERKWIKREGAQKRKRYRATERQTRERTKALSV